MDYSSHVAQDTQDYGEFCHFFCLAYCDMVGPKTHKTDSVLN